MSTLPAALRVAAAQYPLDAVADMNAWEGKVATWVATGAETGAELLVFPEYGAIEIAAAAGQAAVADLTATLSAVADRVEAAGAVWQRLAARHGVHILAPSGPERRGTGFVNAARLYAPGGGVGFQDKLILTPFERDWGMRSGNGQRVFETAIGRLAIAICYDSEFPLLVRALADAGAEIVLVPSCTEHVSGHSRVRTAAMARALESQIVTIMSPTVGDAPWSPVVDRNRGAAGVFVPADIALSMSGVLAEGALDAPCWLATDVDLAALRRLRDGGEMRNRRDWGLQPGVNGMAAAVTVATLR